jgi:hypothetical protein
MQKFYKILILFIVAMAVTNMVMAQGFPPDDLHDKISTIKKMKLLEILKLDEEQTNKFIAKYSFWENKIKASRDEIRVKAIVLEKAISDNESDAKIAKLSQALLELQKKHFKEMGEFHQSMQAVLDDVQYAKFLVFEIKFPQELKRLLRKRNGRGGRGDGDRQGGRGQGNGPGGGGW